MRIFPIYESCLLYNPFNKEQRKQAYYVGMSAGNADILICFYNGMPLNIRWFTDKKEYQRFIKTLSKNYKKSYENTETHNYTVYPDVREEIPF